MHQINALLFFLMIPIALAQHGPHPDMEPPPSSPDSKELTQALHAAKKWLKKVDAGNYTDAYQDGSTFFRNAINQKDWTTKVQSARKPFGKLINRKKISQELIKSTRNMPGAPDGEYAIFQFQTEFKKKAKATETITQFREKDGKWRAAGYFIK